MQALHVDSITQPKAPIFTTDTYHMVLSEIFSPEHSIAIWQRQPQAEIKQYFQAVFKELGLGLKAVFSMSSLRSGLEDSLPDAPGKTATIEDIHLVSDMLTCLFNCENVGLRLVPLDAAMCPKFHTDNIPVRLVTTYLGPGTEWLSTLPTPKYSPLNGSIPMSGEQQRAAIQPESIKQLSTFDVALLKGTAWEGQEHMGCVHRSCHVEQHQQRVLLTLDPM